MKNGTGVDPGTNPGTSARRHVRARSIGTRVMLAAATVSVAVSGLAGCTSGGSSGQPGSAGTAPPKPAAIPAATASDAPGTTPSPTAASHIPVLGGGRPGSGPSIATPSYVDAPATGPELAWSPLGTGSEIARGGPGFAVRFDPGRVRFALHAGSQVPGGAGWPGGSAAPTRGLVAGWNGGFLLANGASWGGFYLGGKTVFGPLKAGAASEVFYSDGTMDVLAWPGGEPAPDVTGVRQNLALLVDGGKPAADLNGGTAADEHTWGFTNDDSNEHGNRSGVGVTADGKVVYAAVKGASPSQVAEFLLKAGTVRAMQLDINMSRPIFGTYSGHWSQPVPWLGAATQFTGGDARDFVAVYAR